MDEMQTFERRVATEVVHGMGPSEPVDDAAIFTAITATQSPKWRFQSLFSATKVVVAGAIVALFGGFLLAGVLTQPRGDEQAPAVGASASAMAQDAEAEQSELSPSPGTFTPTGSLATPREGHTATLLPDGRVLVLGGFNGSGKVASAEVWDPSAMSFEPAGSIAAGGGVGLTATLLSDGRVLVVGDGAYGWPRGESPESPADVEIWDPATRSFSPAGPQAGRALHTATLLSDGRVLFAGGNSWDAERDAYDAPNEVWDPKTGSFTPAGPMAEARYEPTATLLPDGRVLIIGGSEPGDSSGDTLFTAEVWDPATESFSPAGSLERARWGHSATLLSDGRVLVVGGTDYSETVPGPPYVYAAEVWDPATESFSPAGSLEQGRWRSGHTATLLPDGRVLVVGGGAPGADIWDPATESFSPDGTPLERRLSHTATLLPDGRVLLVGGAGNGSAEIWSPADYEAPTDEEARVASDPELLPGVDLVTEEVEPGVYRVLSDDAGHDLMAEPPASVTVAPDVSVWLLRGISWNPGLTPWDRADAVYRLGQEGIEPFDPAGLAGWGYDFSVDADGVAWVRTGDDATLRTLDGSTWASPSWPDGSASVAGIESTVDGAVWVTQSVENGPGPRVARIANGEWTVLPTLADPTRAGFFHGAPGYFAAAPDGTAWLANGNWNVFDAVASAPQGLLHFDGIGWQVVELPVDDASTWKAGPLALGPDGTLWVFLEPDTGNHLACMPGQLARLSDGEWTLFEHRPPRTRTPRIGDLPPIVCGQGPEASLAVDHEGRLWVAASEHGVRSFDGASWQLYLADLQVNRVAVLPDGSVIATALYACEQATRGEGCSGGLYGDLTGAGLYVITPEAVADE